MIKFTFLKPVQMSFDISSGMISINKLVVLSGSNPVLRLMRLIFSWNRTTCLRVLVQHGLFIDILLERLKKRNEREMRSENSVYFLFSFLFCKKTHWSPNFKKNTLFLFIKQPLSFQQRVAGEAVVAHHPSFVFCSSSRDLGLF